MNRTLQLFPFFFSLLATTAHAQFPQSLQLNATAPTIIRSATTRAGWQYTITVTGTYSMWPSYSARGVDAEYVYDVPQQEVQAFRWPPLFIYAIPHWVGDTLEVPPFELPGQQFKFRTRDNIGFRYNGQPLVDRGLDASHRYQTTLIGDGEPISFQILDSAYSIRDGRIIPRYEDNSGSLSIVIDERPYMNVCGVRSYCDGGAMHLAIAASLLEYDSLGRPRNVLRQSSQFAVAVDGKVIEADSISCSSRAPVSYTLVIDRSGSMRFAYDGATSRLSALKRAAHGFLRTMKPNDRATLITFSYDSDITLDVPWTSDTARLGAGIEAIFPLGGTAWRDAAWQGLDLASKDYNPLNAVVLLTDGDDTHSRRTIEQVTAKARLVNIPVFSIGMALVDSSEQPLRYLSAQSNGRFFQARDQRAIDSAFNNLSRAIESDECCTLYVTLPNAVTDRPGIKTFDLIARGEVTTSAIVSYDFYVSDSCNAPSAVPFVGHAAMQLTVLPNPATSSARLSFDGRRAGDALIELVASNGRVEKFRAGHIDAGHQSLSIPLSGLPSGIYSVRLVVDGAELARDRIVVLR